MIDSDLYEFNLEDYTLPGFCSGDKQYYGTIADMQKLIDNLESDEKIKEDHQDTIAAFNAFKNGNLNAVHIVAYNNRILGRPVKYVAFSNQTIENKSWDHRNTYGFLYHMKAEKIDVSQLVIKLGPKEFVRVARATFKNLVYENDFGPHVLRTYWGFPYMITNSADEDENVISSNQLYTIEQTYNNVDDALTDLYNPEKISFTEILNDIFADG